MLVVATLISFEIFGTVFTQISPLHYVAHQNTGSTDENRCHESQIHLYFSRGEPHA